MEMDKGSVYGGSILVLIPRTDAVFVRQEVRTPWIRFVTNCIMANGGMQMMNGGFCWRGDVFSFRLVENLVFRRCTVAIGPFCASRSNRSPHRYDQMPATVRGLMTKKAVKGKRIGPLPPPPQLTSFRHDSSFPSSSFSFAPHPGMCS